MSETLFHFRCVNFPQNCANQIGCLPLDLLVQFHKFPHYFSSLTDHIGLQLPKTVLQMLLLLATGNPTQDMRQEFSILFLLDVVQFDLTEEVLGVVFDFRAQEGFQELRN